MKTVLISVITHKRPEWCLNLLSQIKAQGEGYNIKVVVFHDICNSDYSSVKDFIKENNWSYIQTAQNFGKWRFWELLNLIYTYCSSIEYDYFIQLPDDVKLIDDFFNKAICMPKQNDVINFLTLKLHKRLFSNYEKTWLVPTGWSDNCFITGQGTVEKIRLNMPLNTKNKSLNKGTGTGSEFSKQHKTTFLENKIYQTQKALVEHLGVKDLTVMHTSEMIKNRTDEFESLL